MGGRAGDHGHQRPDDPGEGRDHAQLPRGRGVEDVALEGTLWTVTGTLEGDAHGEPRHRAGHHHVRRRHRCRVRRLQHRLGQLHRHRHHHRVRRNCSSPAWRATSRRRRWRPRWHPCSPGTRTYDIEGTKLTIATAGGHRSHAHLGALTEGRQVAAMKSAITFASSGPLSSWRKWPPPSMVRVRLALGAGHPRRNAVAHRR